MEEKKFEGKTKIIVTIDDIHCGDCALNIERSVEHVPGSSLQRSVIVLSSATVYYDPHRVEEDRIKKAITKPGYVVRETLAEKTQSLLEDEEVISSFWACRDHSGLFLDSGVDWPGASSYLPKALAIASLVIGGYPVLKSAIKALFIPDLNVDTLVSIAAIAATSVGAYREAAAVLFIMLLGEFLEGTHRGESSERPLPL